MDKILADIQGLKKYIPFRESLYALRNRIIGRERKISLGTENPDKIFYIIGQEDDCGGLFWLINKVVMHIAYAIDNGYIPVIDFMHYHTQYSTIQTYGKVNLWDKIFKQPFGYSLDDIAHSKNIIINKMSPAPHKKYLMGQNDFYDNDIRLRYFQNIFHNYIKFNEQTTKSLEETIRQIIPNPNQVVGVLCRGTDYTLLKPKGHPIQPSPIHVIEDVKRAMKKYNCVYVFIATEDAEIFETFHKEFKENLLFIPQKRYYTKEMSGKHFLATEKKRDMTRDPWEDAITYLKSIYILSKCKCFISGRTGGAKGVLLMTKGFEYNNLYNLGLYK